MFYDLIPKIKAREIPEGWFWNRFDQWQKVNHNVYAYVGPIFGGFKTQLYERGNRSVCELEARTKGSASLMFQLAESWLEKYGNATLPEIRQDFYSIHNLHGAWGHDSHLKAYWVKG